MKKRVLIADDSYVAREALRIVMTQDPELEVVAAVANGRQALEAVERYRPDVVTMDMVMPEMDGFEATRAIMETHPTPIVIATASWGLLDTGRTFRAMEAGAVAVVQKPRGVDADDPVVTELLTTVKLMADVKVVRRWPKARRAVQSETVGASYANPCAGAASGAVRVIAIGASTGGPAALQELLAALPKPCNVPVVVVQHIAPGFVEGMVKWLNDSCGLDVQLPTNGARMSPGVVYIAPDGLQMGVSGHGVISVRPDEPEDGLRPAVSYLFRSVLDSYGAECAAVILTGMGRDGVAELKQLRERGAMTFAQDEPSSVVFGMPGEAVKSNAATWTGSPAGIAERIGELLHSRDNESAM